MPAANVETPLIAILAEARMRKGDRQLANLCDAVMRAGHALLLLDAEDPAATALDSVDLVVARGRSAAVLAFLARAEGLGIRTVNRCAAIAQVRDRAAALRTLHNSGVPAPGSSAGTIESISRAFQPHEYPIVVKPLYAEDRAGLRLVHSRDELLSLPWPKVPAVAQRFVPSDGFDLKLYVVGSDVYAMREPSALTGSAAMPRRPVSVSPPMRALARRCGLAFGLELFSVTCVELSAGPIAIAVDDFPDYAGIPLADERLARFVIDRACGAKRR